MPRQNQHRDTQGCFTRSTQQPEEQPQTTPSQPRTRRSRISRAFLAVSSPLHSGVPISEAVVCTATIFQESSSDTPTPSLLDSEDNLSPPNRYVSPPCYTSDPPLPCPDFSALKSDDPAPLVPPPSPTGNDIAQPAWQPALDFLDNKFFFADNKQLRPQPPPLSPCQPRSPPQPQRQPQRSRQVSPPPRTRPPP